MKFVRTLGSRLGAFWLIPVLALLLLAPTGAHAQGRPHQPIITGTASSSMDAPETNKQLESYERSGSVTFLARHLGISTIEAGRLFEDLNSGLLIAVILYFLLTRVPPMFREKRKKLAEDLVAAQKATADAEERLKRVEARLASLDGEIRELREHAAELNRAEEGRIRASMEEERERIVRSAQAEIAAAQASAERGLRRYAADLAVERAAERVRLSQDGDRMLVDAFFEDLARAPGMRERN